MEEIKKKIRSFQELDVYQNSYAAMLEIFKHILPKLPSEEKYDLRDQLQRSSKAVPRLIAEGHYISPKNRFEEMGWATGLVNSNLLMVFPYDQRPTPKPAAQPFNRKLHFFQHNLSVAWTKFTEQKTLSTNNHKLN